MTAPFRKNITICGIKHAGKTSAAKALSAMTGIEYSDSDDALKDLFLRETGRDLSVREIFSELGETEFRKLETRALRKLFSAPGRHIIALGGGVLSNPFLTEEDRKNFGFLCCVDVKDETAYERILVRGLPPFLKDKPDPFSAFCEMNRTRREVFRACADIVIRTDEIPEVTPQKTAERILSACKELS